MMGILDVVLGPVAGVAAEVATRVLAPMISSNPWVRRGVGLAGTAGGMVLSATVAPRIGTGLATGCLNAAVGDDLTEFAHKHLPSSSSNTGPDRRMGMGAVYVPRQLEAVVEIGDAEYSDAQIDAVVEMFSR
jgi:hypothetical protein